MATLKRKI